MSLIEKIDAEIKKQYDNSKNFQELISSAGIIRGLEIAKEIIISEQKESCKGCQHYGNYENEVEYGYPSPCTRCKRRCVDNYQPNAADNNVVTIGDKIRESNESMAEFIKTVTDKCIIGSCRTCPIYKACDQMENKEDLARYFSQPYTE